MEEQCVNIENYIGQYINIAGIWGCCSSGNKYMIRKVNLLDDKLHKGDADNLTGNLIQSRALLKLNNIKQMTKFVPHKHLWSLVTIRAKVAKINTSDNGTFYTFEDASIITWTIKTESVYSCYSSNGDIWNFNSWQEAIGKSIELSRCNN